MKLQLASDLHLEYSDSDIPNLIIPEGDILVLAGDIGSLYNLKQLKSFFNYYCKKKYKIMILLITVTKSFILYIHILYKHLHYIIHST